MKKRTITTFLLTLLLTLAFSITVFAEEAQQETTTTMYATANVNVRTGDSTTNKKLGTLAKGQSVTSSGKTEKGWYIVDYNGQTGYVSGKYLTDNAPATTPAPATTTTTQASSGETKTINGVTFVQQGYTPNGLKIWCASWDTEGTWADFLIAAYDATGITNDMSDYDKAVAINNYICKVVHYPTSDEGEIDDRALTARCLTYGKATCVGYANAFDTLCTMAGVYCDSVVGGAGGAAHAWNYVLIGDTKYWVDVCWNDTSNNAYLMSTTQFADHFCEYEK